MANEAKSYGIPSRDDLKARFVLNQKQIGQMLEDWRDNFFQTSKKYVQYELYPLIHFNLEHILLPKRFISDIMKDVLKNKGYTVGDSTIYADSYLITL